MTDHNYFKSEIGELAGQKYQMSVWCLRGAGERHGETRVS